MATLRAVWETLEWFSSSVNHHTDVAPLGFFGTRAVVLLSHGDAMSATRGIACEVSEPHGRVQVAPTRSDQFRRHQREVSVAPPSFFAQFRVAPRRARVLSGVVAVAIAVAIPAVGVTPAGAAVPKFPAAAWSTTIGPTHLSSPVIADVNGDGHLDVVTADLSGMLHVLDGRNGRDLPGWPQPVQVDSRPDRRGRVEPDGCRSRQQRPQGDHRRRGVDRHRRPAGRRRRVQRERLGAVAHSARRPSRARTVSSGTPAVGDVNGDGFPDVVFGSFDHRIYVVNRLGRRAARLPDRQARHDLGLARALRRGAHRPDGHLPRRRREPRRSVRQLELVRHPARDPRDIGRTAGAVVALPASDLPVEPRDR